MGDLVSEHQTYDANVGKEEEKSSEQWLHFENTYANNQIRRRVLQQTPIGRRYPKIPFVKTYNSSKILIGLCLYICFFVFICSFFLKKANKNKIGEYVLWKKKDDNWIRGGKILKQNKNTNQIEVQPFKSMNDKPLMLDDTVISVKDTDICNIQKSQNDLMLVYDWQMKLDVLCKDTKQPIWQKVYMIAFFLCVFVIFRYFFFVCLTFF